ncbi:MULTISPECIES: ABC transporter permease [Rhizobium]|uniref:Iron ABC transporter permease n=1 Tax=Rhizobium bangladeshense TaxID=1138189 RepID=A0ABS7LG67_9HYPH|nr:MULTISPECIES: iron ABC transporter permease [Rhizobium]MBX4875526.1 iron ABC transporter permease [Rhizobium bangladeshense]MBX4886632.1 iron ABC transporter permease [Rhizobium bangladeshense]MBX4894655.1 iron ABC transporter permease [Rhizobium bangladeshense]MBX4903460.1 iron ABC transporter permease [Rhizobium bangladeshense]MBX4914849.1 iron ABC transporter permease [Rhizobium bangladeshense]
MFSSPAPARSAKRPGRVWLTIAATIALIAILPIGGLILEASKGSAGLWGHLFSTILPVALLDTVILLAGVGVITAVVGTTTAWLVTAYDFPGRHALEWMLLLPLAVPTYIVAYAYLDIMHPIGPVQDAVRWLLGYETPRQFRLPDVRSMAGCILLLGIVLYPYVYIPTRAMFLTQSGNLVDAARTLGTTRRAVFWRVALPLARPAVAVGISLALMETLNDIGAAEFLGVRTITVSIYTTWITRSDLSGASQIALALLLIVVAIVALERWARRKQRYAIDVRRMRNFQPRRVPLGKGILLFLGGLLPVILGFAAPALYLLIEAAKRYRFAGISPRIIDEAVNTLVIATLATVATVILGLLAAYATRLRPGQPSSWLLRCSTMGYAAPGTVVAIGVLIILGGLDQFIDRTVLSLFDVSTGLLLMGSGAAVIYALVVRFLAISAGGIEAGLSRISPSLDHASRSLGQSTAGTLRYVHLPLSKAAISAAALLVFVDCVKELPATLLLRPLNVETFATHLYGEAARGTYEEASIAALAIVLIGILPAILLSRIGRIR